MKSAQYTPEHWYVGEDRPTGYTHILAPATERGGPVKIICDMQTFALNHAEHAYLIAAAPELLAACEHALDAVKAYPEHPMTASEVMLRTAITKAKGKA